MNHTLKAFKCGPCIFEIEDLDLTASGFPGLSFAGDLSIEPDDSLDNEDWYIEAAHATNSDGKTFTIYNGRTHPALFSAICEAVITDRDLCDIITETAREHGEWA